jgi:hypothetical protein
MGGFLLFGLRVGERQNSEFRIQVFRPRFGFWKGNGGTPGKGGDRPEWREGVVMGVVEGVHGRGDRGRG